MRVGDSRGLRPTVFAANHDSAVPCIAVQARETPNNYITGIVSSSGSASSGSTLVVSSSGSASSGSGLSNPTECRRRSQRGMCDSRFIPSISSMHEAKLTPNNLIDSVCQSESILAHPDHRVTVHPPPSENGI